MANLDRALSSAYEKSSMGPDSSAYTRDSRKSINDLINENEDAKPSQEDADALLTGQRQ